MLGSKTLNDFEWLTYASCLTRVLQIANALQILTISENLLGLKVLGILSANRKEWVLVDIACMGVDVATVGLCDKDTDEQLAYKLEKTRLRYLCTDIAGFKQIIRLKHAGKAQDLEFIFCFDSIEESEKAQAIDANLKIFNFKDFKCFENKPIVKKIEPKNLCMLAFTAGTTDLPKLVQISHEALMASFTAILHGSFEINAEDVHLTTTHFSDLTEKILMFVGIISGASIAISNSFKDDVKIIRPSILYTLPRFLDFLYVQFQEDIEKQSSLSQKMFKKSYAKKLKNYLRGEEVKKSIWDNPTFKSIREKLGGRLRSIFVSGSLSNVECLTFFKVILGCEIIESYGTVEACEFNTCGGRDRVFGHVGGPLASCELRLVYQSNLEFDGIDALKIGELLIKNNSTPLGYIDESNINSDGWIQTGDLFRLIDDIGAFQFIDKLEYVLKLKNGKAVAPQALEILYRQSKFVAQILVYGDYRIDGLVAVVVPDERFVMKHFEGQGLSFSQICENINFSRELLKSLEEICNSKGRRQYEKIKDLVIEPVPWTSQEFITNTLKIKRKVLLQKYDAQIQEMIHKLVILV